MKELKGDPITRLILRLIYNKTIIGQADNEEKRVICNQIIEHLLKITNIPEKELKKRLNHKLKIIYTEDIETNDKSPRTLGNQIGDKIIIGYSTIREILKKPPEKNEKNYKIVVHEGIHKIQNLKHLYKGCNIKGFIEGATEFITRKAFENRPHSMSMGSYHCNIKSGSYNVPVCIMAQLEVMFGKEKVERFAILGEKTLLDDIINKFGYKTFRRLSKQLIESIYDNKKGEKCMKMQDEILHSYFDKKIKEVRSLEDAENLLNQLKEIDEVRMHKSDDNRFATYYIKQFERFSKKFPQLDREKYKYRPVEVYPEIYEDEQFEKLDRYTLQNLTPRSLDGYKRLKLDEYKRYRYISNNDVFETITHNGKLKYYQCCDGNARTILLDVDNPSHRQIIKDMGLKFLKNDNDVYLFRNNVLLYKMQEVPLNVTREDIYERMENISRKKQCQKSHRKLKALPPYEDVESEIKISDSRKKDKWWNMKIGNNTYMPEDKKAEFERDPKEDNIQDI